MRKAKKYIYVENQYFMGSAMDWLNFDDKNYNVECKNRVPIELVMRIVPGPPLTTKYFLFSILNCLSPNIFLLPHVMQLIPAPSCSLALNVHFGLPDPSHCLDWSFFFWEGLA